MQVLLAARHSVRPREPGDEFGGSLAIGDVGGSSTDDLAIGADREDLGAIVDAGVVQLLPGGSSGLTATGSQRWHQDVSGIAGSAENGDRWDRCWRSATQQGRVRRLAVGVPHEGVDAFADAGALHVLRGAHRS